jgi:hypothetical protein
MVDFLWGFTLLLFPWLLLEASRTCTADVAQVVQVSLKATVGGLVYNGP